MKIFPILLLVFNTLLSFGQIELKVTQGEDKSKKEVLDEFKSNLCDGYYLLLTRSYDNEYTTPLKGDKFKFKHDGSVNAKINGQKRKGVWTANLWYLENECDLKIEFSDTVYCFNISSTSGWKKRTNKITPWSFHVKTENKEYVFVNKFSYAKRSQKLNKRRLSLRFKRKYELTL